MTKNDGATNNSRIKNTSRNTFFGALMYLAKIVLQFVVRAFFNRYFISEYLGLNGLYTNILNVLSLAELGVGNAIVYSMYKPISENDTETIKSLVALYKKIYCIIVILKNRGKKNGEYTRENKGKAIISKKQERMYYISPKQ